MPRLDDNPALFTKMINDTTSGLPVTLVISRLCLIILALCQTLDDAGRESSVLLANAIKETET